ncbi:hypothetical protein GX411_00980 [Candidatus Fermentibacteria bacterium]|nr:hypothetical protein [Candidatus Fermentibacteria bacterium]
MPARNRRPPVLLAAACAALPALASLLLFDRPASTLCDAVSLAGIGGELAAADGASSERPALDSLAEWAGFRLPSGAALEPGTSGAACSLFPYRIAAFSFPSDSSVMVLVSCPVPLALRDPGPGGPSVLTGGGRTAVIVIPGARESHAAAAAGSVEPL